MSLNKFDRRVVYTILLFKLIFAYIAWVYVGVSRLGDTSAYLNGYYLFRDDFTSTAFLLSWLGDKSVRLLGFSFLANMPFLLMNWICFVYMYKALDHQVRNKYMVFIIMLSPSSLVWTSLLTKEAFVSSLFCLYLTMSIGILLGFRASRYEWIIYLLLIVSIIFFKPFYAAATIWIAYFIYLERGGRLKIYFGVPLFLIFLGLGLYEYYETLSFSASGLNRHFSSDGNLTRTGIYCENALDMFLSMGSGLFTSFIGPYFKEGLERSDLMFFWIEGFLGLLLIAFLLGSGLKRKGFFVFLMMLVLVFLMLVAHYPFGYFNAGSAVRYKQSFYFPMILFLYFVGFDNRFRSRYNQ